MADIICTNLVAGELEDTYAQFKNSVNQNHNLGECYFTVCQYNAEDEKWYINNILGYTANGQSFEYGTLEVIEEDFDDFETGKLNPTKVFWYIVKKIKGVLCPSCM